MTKKKIQRKTLQSKFTFSEPAVANGFPLINVLPNSMALQPGNGGKCSFSTIVHKKGQEEPIIKTNEYYEAGKVVFMKGKETKTIALIYAKCECKHQLKLGFPVKAEELPKGYEKAVRHFVTENF